MQQHPSHHCLKDVQLPLQALDLLRHATDPAVASWQVAHSPTVGVLAQWSNGLGLLGLGWETAVPSPGQKIVHGDVLIGILWYFGGIDPSCESKKDDLALLAVNSALLCAHNRDPAGRLLNPATMLDWVEVPNQWSGQI